MGLSASGNAAFPVYPVRPDGLDSFTVSVWNRQYPKFVRDYYTLVKEYYRLCGLSLLDGSSGGVRKSCGLFESLPEDSCERSSGVTSGDVSVGETSGGCLPVGSSTKIEEVNTAVSVLTSEVRGKWHASNVKKRNKKRVKQKESSQCVTTEAELVRLEREKVQLAISEAYLVKQKEQAEISRLYRLKQERLENDVASAQVQLEIQRKEKRLKNLRLDQQLKTWDGSAEAVARRKKEMIAKSELNIAKYENMVERKLKLQEIERKENWREEASGIPSVQGSVQTASSSGSISVNSSASQRVSSSATSVVSGGSKISAKLRVESLVAKKQREDMQRESEYRIHLLRILDSGGEFDTVHDENEAERYALLRSAANSALEQKKKQAIINAKKGWF